MWVHMRNAVIGTVLALAVGGFLGVHAFSSDAAMPKKHKVVIQVQVDGEERWNEVLGNIENLNKAFGPENLDVVVVAHGKALGLVLPQCASKDRLEKLSLLGTKFEVCQNTLNKNKVTSSDVLPFVVTVDAGVAEIVRRQEQGYAYLKAGS